MWALAQVLPDIVNAFCLSLIVGETARQKVAANGTACRSGGIVAVSAPAYRR